MSIAVSRSRSSNSVPNGRRYFTLYSREPPVVSWRLAEPFGHSRPRLTGESGSPSIWVTFPPETYTFWPQPTAQYGQTDLITWSAVATRGRLSAVILLFTAAPRPVASGPDSCRYTGHSAIHVRTPIQTDPPPPPADPYRLFSLSSTPAPLYSWPVLIARSGAGLTA